MMELKHRDSNNILKLHGKSEARLRFTSRQGGTRIHAFKEEPTLPLIKAGLCNGEELSHIESVVFLASSLPSCLALNTMLTQVKMIFFHI
jgi:hypothetical protein